MIKGFNIGVKFSMSELDNKISDRIESLCDTESEEINQENSLEIYSEPNIEPNDKINQVRDKVEDNIDIEDDDGYVDGEPYEEDDDDDIEIEIEEEEPDEYDDTEEEPEDDDIEIEIEEEPEDDNTEIEIEEEQEDDDTEIEIEEEPEDDNSDDEYSFDYSDNDTDEDEYSLEDLNDSSDEDEYSFEESDDDDMDDESNYAEESISTSIDKPKTSFADKYKINVPTTSMADKYKINVPTPSIADKQTSNNQKTSFADKYKINVTKQDAVTSPVVNDTKPMKNTETTHTTNEVKKEVQAVNNERREDINQAVHAIQEVSCKPISKPVRLDTQEQKVEEVHPITLNREDRIVSDKTETVNSAYEKKINNIDNTSEKTKELEAKLLMERKKKELIKRKLIELRKEKEKGVDYSSMTVDTLYENVKEYMLSLGVNKQLIDKEILIKKFGSTNVNKLILKSYLIVIGKGVTTGK